MDAVEEIKNRLAIEDVVGEYVQLKRSGRNWKGLSPFSNEKTPSFIVSPEKQIWHDFSSGKGGNVFSFVMEMEGLDFKATLELLARKAGVDLEQLNRYQSSAGAKSKEQIYKILELAAKYYQVQLSNNKPALEYVFKKRQFTKETALTFQIGYSPIADSPLVDFLRRKEFSDADIKAAGLSTVGYRGITRDMFRGRIMIPLHDAQGRVIGFTARLLSDDKNSPKYINTPQTVLYDKSRHIFGLHLAKESIRKKQYAVLVEGNLDVIASHQVGIKQVVATAGTALTEQHLKGLSRFTGDIRLSFDADRAGILATERAIPIASKVGVNLSIVILPIGKDPDDLIKDDMKLWETTIEHPEYALDWLIDRYQQELDLNTAIGKRQFSDIILAVIRRLEDRVEQEHYTQKLAGIIGVSQAALTAKLNEKNETARRFKKRADIAVNTTMDQTDLDREKYQDRLLSLALLQAHLRDFLTPLTVDMLPKSAAKQLLKFLQDNPGFAGDATAAQPLHTIGDYVKILVLQYEALYQNIDVLELRYEAARLQAQLIERYVKMQKHDLAAQLHVANENETQALLKQVKHLDTLLKQVKET